MNLVCWSKPAGIASERSGSSHDARLRNLRERIRRRERVSPGLFASIVWNGVAASHRAEPCRGAGQGAGDGRANVDLGRATEALDVPTSFAPDPGNGRRAVHSKTADGTDPVAAAK